MCVKAGVVIEEIDPTRSASLVIALDTMLETAAVEDAEAEADPTNAETEEAEAEVTRDHQDAMTAATAEVVTEETMVDVVIETEVTTETIEIAETAAEDHLHLALQFLLKRITGIEEDHLLAKTTLTSTNNAIRADPTQENNRQLTHLRVMVPREKPRTRSLKAKLTTSDYGEKKLTDRRHIHTGYYYNVRILR